MHLSKDLDRTKDFHYWFYNLLQSEIKRMNRQNFMKTLKTKLVAKKYYSLEAALVDKLGF